MTTNLDRQEQFLFYQSTDGTTKIQVILGDETVWATQKSIAELMGVGIPAISKHIKNIFEEGELPNNTTVSKMETVVNRGFRGEVTEVLDFYNLDMIIAVGYRVNSYKATQFRIWATGILKEYLIKGFALDDDRLKQGQHFFNKDYFEELLERIREIRASERLFYQKITDIYAQCSIDYDAKSPITQTFFATVQNKLEYAITKHTASELIKLRADSEKPNMGLTSWKNEKKGGKILKTDVTVAKNYLKHQEITELNQIVNMYLDYAELQAKRNKTMNMAHWIGKLDTFLSFNEYDLLTDAGKMKAEIAKKFAEKEYEKFRVVQDKNYVSDFDKVMNNINTSSKLPTHTIPQSISIKEAMGNKKLSNKK